MMIAEKLASPFIPKSEDPIDDKIRKFWTFDFDYAWFLSMMWITRLSSGIDNIQFHHMTGKTLSFRQQRLITGSDCNLNENVSENNGLL
jgi:hypothetical protein